MIAYFSPFLTFVFLRWGLSKHQRLQKQIYWVLLSAMFLFVAFRFEVGCDWTGYLAQFQIVSSVFYDPWQAQRDIGWWLTLNILEEVGLPYPVINVVVGVQFFLCMHLVARRQPDPMAFLLALFPVLVIGMAMAALRQAMAIGFVSVAFLALADRRAGSYISWIVVASLFHSSAMVFAPLAPLVGGHAGRWRAIVTLVLLVPSSVALLSSSSADLAAERYLVGGAVAEGGVYRIGFLFLTGLSYVGFLRKSWSLEYRSDLHLVTLGAFGMILVGLLLPASTVIADRIAYYLIPIQAIIISRIPYLSSRNRTALISLPWIGLTALLAVWLTNSGIAQRCYVPYQSWIAGYPEIIRYSF